MLKKNVETFLECNKTYKEAEIVLFGAPLIPLLLSVRNPVLATLSVMNLFWTESYSPYQDKDLIDSKIMDSGDLELCFEIQRRCFRILNAVRGF